MGVGTFFTGQVKCKFCGRVYKSFGNGGIFRNLLNIIEIPIWLLFHPSKYCSGTCKSLAKQAKMEK